MGLFGILSFHFYFFPPLQPLMNLFVEMAQLPFKASKYRSVIIMFFFFYYSGYPLWYGFVLWSWNWFYLQIALRREKLGDTAPFWNFSAASYPDLEEKKRTGIFIPETNQSLNGNANVDTSSRVYILYLYQAAIAWLFPILLCGICLFYIFSIDHVLSYRAVYIQFSFLFGRVMYILWSLMMTFQQIKFLMPIGVFSMMKM